MEKIISNQVTASAAQAEQATSLPQPQRRSKSAKLGYKQFSTALTYMSVITLIISLVSVGYQSPVEEQGGANGVAARTIEIDAPSVDQMVAASLAATTASVADLSIASNVSNLSISLNAKSELAQSNDNILSKPQIIEADYGGILTSYRVVSGDAVGSVASRHGISSQTLKWANNLYSDALEPGKTLLIPSTDGVVYTVKDGDTIASIARHFNANRDRIVTFNNLELGGLRAGKRLVIPGGILPVDERPSAPAVSYGGGGTSYGYNAASVGNRYSYGYCTYYVYNRRAELGRPVGSFWGDAVTWAGFAASSGYKVNNTPAPGAVLHDPNSAPPWGHVAVVEEVYSDGSIRVSEMNYAGWNVISSRTISAGAAGSFQYIH